MYIQVYREQFRKPTEDPLLTNGAKLSPTFVLLLAAPQLTPKCSPCRVRPCPHDVEYAVYII